MKALPQKRFRHVAILLSAIIGFIVVRAFSLQIVGDSRLDILSKRQFFGRVLIRPHRGLILDRNGESLAINAQIESLAANPSMIRDPKHLAQLIGRAVQVSEARLLSKLRSGKEFVWIKRHLSDSEVERLQKLKLLDQKGNLIRGLLLVKEINRIYPQGELASHILGDVNLDAEGVEGVEYWLDSTLRGEVVSIAAVRDALGRPAFMDAQAAREVQDGRSATLTIDSALQYSVEKALKESVEATGSKAGMAIVMDAKSGEILSLANVPTFNANQLSPDPSVRRNRAFTDSFEPGSVMKPLMLVAAIESGMKLSDQLWGERGELKLHGHTISEAESHEKFEWISLKKMIQVSSNVASAKLAMKLGYEKVFQTFRLLGFGESTGVGFPGEASGLLHKPSKKNSPILTATVGYGHGISATAIQLARAYSVIFNGGYEVTPRLLMSENEAVTPPKRLISQNVVNAIHESLAAVVQPPLGTGTRARVDGHRVIGKTGTAMVVDPKGRGYLPGKYVSTFIGTATDISPQVTILATLFEPTGNYYASETATPLFRTILEATLSRFSIPSDPKLTLSSESPEMAQLDAIKVSMGHPVSVPPKLVRERFNPDGRAIFRMPDLRGLSPRESLRILAQRPFRVKILGTGVVRSQIPAPMQDLLDNGEVALWLHEEQEWTERN